jgi:hypothetical protein
MYQEKSGNPGRRWSQGRSCTYTVEVDDVYALWGRIIKYGIYQHCNCIVMMETNPVEADFKIKQVQTRVCSVVKRSLKIVKL